MALVKINWNPDSKVIREFSEVWLFFFGMILTPLAWSRGHSNQAAAFWLVAVAGRLFGMWRPDLMKYAFLAMTVVFFPVGWAISHLAMAIIFYGVFTPVALIFRLIGRDPLKRSFDRNAKSYWEEHNPDRGPARYLRQF